MYILFSFSLLKRYTHILQKRATAVGSEGGLEGITRTVNPALWLSHSTTLEDTVWNVKAKSIFGFVRVSSAQNFLLCIGFFQTGTGTWVLLCMRLQSPLNSGTEKSLFNPIGRVESDPIERDIVHFYGGVVVRKRWQAGKVFMTYFSHVVTFYTQKEKERNSIGIMGYI